MKDLRRSQERAGRLHLAHQWLVVGACLAFPLCFNYLVGTYLARRPGIARIGVSTAWPVGDLL